MRDLSSLVAYPLMQLHVLTSLWLNNYQMGLATLSYSSLSWPFFEMNLRKHWEGGIDILTKLLLLHCAILLKWKQFFTFLLFWIQPICFASELLPILPAHAWFRCSNNDSSTPVSRWARRWRTGSRKGFKTSHLRFSFLILRFIWTKAHVLQIDKDQAELAHANFAILRKEDQPILNLVQSFETLLLPISFMFYPCFSLLLFIIMIFLLVPLLMLTLVICLICTLGLWWNSKK